MKASVSAFTEALRRFQLRWQFGLLGAGLLGALLWTALALLLFGVLDYYAGFSDPAREAVARVLATVATAGAIRALWRTVAFMRRDAASQADSVLKSGRREVLSAFELRSGNSAPGASLGAWLRDRAIAGAAAHIETLRFSHCLPIPEVLRGARRFLCLAAAFISCMIFMPRASVMIARRLLDPGADIPPYSPLQFALGPRPAEVLYGGEIVVRADITGGKIDGQVQCLTRDPSNGEIEESPAYQENSARFVSKLEKVSAPLDVAFAVGRARSEWLPVAVRMQPKVQDVMLTVEPPAYSGLPRREFAAGTQDLAALAGSRITARVSSNRPLSGGTLRVGPDPSSPPKEEIAAEREELHRVRFTWVTRGAAHLVFEVRDVLGTASEPLQMEQKLIPDERPEASLIQPAGDVLATPDSNLPIEGLATDDLGLTHVSMVRKLIGYRERSQPQPVETGSRRCEVKGNLNLSLLGVAPGQTIELTLEAVDTNPNLLGVSVSEPARVHIIPRELYAELLRNQTTLEDFSSRYSALSDAMDNARKALDELEMAAKSGDAAKTEEARRKALEAHQAAAEWFEKIAGDFPIFDIDKGLARATQDSKQQLLDNSRQLEGLSGQAPGAILGAVPSLKQRLGDMAGKMNDEMEKGRRAVAAGKVFEQAGVYEEIVEAQRSLVKDYNRVLEQIRRGEMPPGEALSDLAKQQREIAESLRAMQKDLRGALDGLPDEYAQMQEQGQEFLNELGQLNIPVVMNDGAKAADASNSQSAGAHASDALARLEALLREKNGFCSMCRGDAVPFPWPEDLAQTLQQLMKALIPKPGSGSEPGNGNDGPGYSGLSDSGYWVRGKMMRLPIYGPSRLRFGRATGLMAGGGKEGSGAGQAGADVDTNTLATQPKGGTGGEAVAAESVPEAYRDAVKRYFSSEETSPGPAAPGSTTSKP